MFAQINNATYLPWVVSRDDGGQIPGDVCPYFI